MRFLVNPECYHKMCESCVDRIFSQGPAPCPVAGCARTLRKQRFRKQTFEDVQVEREVDVRRRVAQVLNRTEAEFQTLRAYNNYLEEVETLTFNLLQGIDVPATEAKLAAYANQNAASIAHNAAVQSKESQTKDARLAGQKEQALRRREAAAREDDLERRERDEGRKEIHNNLAHGPKGEAEQIVKDTRRVVLKQSTARRSKQQQRQHLHDGTDPAAGANGDASLFTIEGLKPVVQDEPEQLFDPFGGLDFRPRYYSLQEDYDHPWLEKAKTDPAITAGGYDVSEYYARTMLEAFAGLGCFIEDEVTERDAPAGAGGATVSAALAASAGGGGENIS